MSSHSADDVKKSVATYWKIGGALFVFTVLTVGANRLHLAVPFAITVALVIAATKGSMVASVFMHLAHEKAWVYWSLLLTVVFFLALIFLPIFTVSDGIGTPTHLPSAIGEAAGGH
jgi:caa(3)-type oxidase subunit IV